MIKKTKENRASERISYQNRFIIFDGKLVTCSCYPFEQRKRKRKYRRASCSRWFTLFFSLLICLLLSYRNE